MKCPECHAEVEQAVGGFCPNCGKMLAEGTAPKVSEGFRLNKNKPATGSGGGTVIVVVCIIIVLLLVVLVPQCSHESAQTQLASDVQTEEQKQSGEFVLPESNARYYSEDELGGLSNWDLYIARNEIYARLGRGFKNDDLVDYFHGCTWYEERYSPEDFESRGPKLNDYEKANANMILSVEKARGSEYV